MSRQQQNCSSVHLVGVKARDCVRRRRHIIISLAGVTPGHYSAVTCYECRVTVVTLPTSVLHCRHYRRTKVPVYYIHTLDGYVLSFPPL